MNQFRKVDFFGTPFIQQIDQNQSIYKSILGGIVTIIIMSASLAYSVWVVYLWQTNQLSPKIQNSLYVSDFQLLDLNYEVINLYFWNALENPIDPFEAKILLPMVLYTNNFTLTEPQRINPTTQISDAGTQQYSPQMKLGFSYMNGKLYTNTEMFILIVKCEEKFLNEGEECASQELTDKFFSQPFNIMELNYKQLDSKDGQIQSSNQKFYIQIEPQSCYTLNTFLQTSTYQVDKSFLFGSPDYYEFINGAMIQPQTNSINYCQTAFSADVISNIFIEMKGNQTKFTFDYPKAGDLLANIGSIVSVLFMVKYVIIFLNEYLVNEKVLKDLINIYYPEYKQIKIKKNWKRQVVEVKFNEQSVEVNEYLKFYQKVRKQLSTKLSYINLLYEVSRLYILIRSEKSREEIRKSHHVGVKLDFLCSDTILKSYSSPRQGKFSIFNDEDITLISLSEKNKMAKSLDVPKELESQQNDFYDINKLV